MLCLSVCPAPINAGGIAASVAVPIFIIGVVIIIVVRIMVEVHDRREYARFMEEREKAKWQRVNLPFQEKKNKEACN